MAKHPVDDNDRTIEYPTRRPLTSAPKPQCRVARDDATTGFQSELASLLHQRLRVAATIIAAAYTVVFVRTFLDRPPYDFEVADYVLVVGMIVGIGGIAAWLWIVETPSLCRLRYAELMVFGCTALHFTIVNVRMLEDRFLMNTFHLLNQGTLVEEADQVWRAIAVQNAMRWFTLIVIYGVFIPNSGWRCAWVVGAIALLPVATILAVGFVDGQWATYLNSLIPDTIIPLGIGVAIAIFGSSRFNVLQHQAYQSRRLGQYQLKQRLGVGGMGEVYLAEHVLLRRPCVVKLIKSERANDPVLQQRFEREVQATATLTHWNVVEIYDYGHTDDGRFYYVMEYLPGVSLQELVGREGPLPPARVVHLLRQVCNALNEAHGIGLIHRDIKPSNIIVCPRGGMHDVAKLLDFGLVLQHSLHGPDASKLTGDGFIVGTPDYLSPEQAQALEQIDGRSDIYSLGAVAYFLLTGQPPFVRKTAMQIVVAHIHEMAPPPSVLVPDIGPDLEAIVVRCLEKRPQDRFLTARELEHALAREAARRPWTEEDAAAWWRERGDHGPVADPPDTEASAPLNLSSLPV